MNNKKLIRAIAIILAVLTLGVLSFFWVDPYIKSTDAALYSVLKGER